MGRGSLATGVGRHGEGFGDQRGHLDEQPGLVQGTGEGTARARQFDGQLLVAWIFAQLCRDLEVHAASLDQTWLGIDLRPAGAR